MAEHSGAPADAPPQCYRHPGRETYIRCQRCERPICPDCMNPASVGFQCPECVEEGKKSVRPHRTVTGGLVPHNVGAVTTGLIAVNVVVFLAIQLTGGSTSKILYGASMLSETIGLPPNGIETTPGVADGAYWRLLTSAFVHVDWWHILLNMYALWLFGPLLERFLGYTRFLGLYLTCGIAGSVAVYWFESPFATTVGASGAIFGLFGAALVLLHKQRQDISSLLVLLAINVVFSFTWSGISWQGHMGGLVAGLVLGAALAYAPRPRRGLIQSAAFGAIGVLLVVAVVLRTAALS